jgi:hypothetical protein
MWERPPDENDPGEVPRVAPPAKAARQGRFWDMHEMLFHRQKALEDGDPGVLRARLLHRGLRPRPGRHRGSGWIRRGVDTGLATGQVLGTPTLFIDGVVHRGGYDPPTLLAAGAMKVIRSWALADDDGGDPADGHHLC